MNSYEETTKAGESTQPGVNDRRQGSRNIDLIMKIPVSVQVVLGSTTMTVSNLMKLSRGSVVKLDRAVGEPVEVLVNGHVVARGEVVVIEEENSRLGVSLTEIIGPPGQNGD
jgi:flagellar motor switch protein FliN